MRNQQTIKDVQSLLDSGGIVTINLTGVSFDNRQDKIKKMINRHEKEIWLIPEPDNEWDEFAIIVASDGKPIGFIPKSKGFSITLPKRKRPISFGKDIIDADGKMLQTNEVFCKTICNMNCRGMVSEFLNYGDDDNIPIGVKIQFWGVN